MHSPRPSQLTPIPEGTPIQYCPPGRAAGADLPNEFTSGDRWQHLDPAAVYMCPSLRRCQ